MSLSDAKAPGQCTAPARERSCIESWPVPLLFERKGRLALPMQASGEAGDSLGKHRRGVSDGRESAKRPRSGQGARVDGLQHLRRAARLLERPGGYLAPRADLAEAFGHVWGGLAAANSWPDELRAQAAGLIVAMRQHGGVYETAHAMTAAEAREFTAMLRAFVDLADRLEVIETVARLRSRGVVSTGLPTHEADQATASAESRGSANS